MEREKGIKDRRIDRTRDRLHEALASLIHEKAYDAIPVREILDRANVGRSTFYMHFGDKDELLASAMREVLMSDASGLPPSARRCERVIAFSWPVFEHIHRQRSQRDGAVGTGTHGVIHEHLRSVLAQWLVERIPAGSLHDQLSTDLVARCVASTFVVVLDWWVQSPVPLAPKDVDEMFRALVLPTLEAALA